MMKELTMMKRLFLPFLFILFSILFSASVNAAVLKEGYWGTNLTWVLTDDGTLTLSGQGKMEDGRYSSNLPIGGPWVSEWKTRIRRVVVEEGLTTIGKYALYSCSALTEVVLPSSVTSIEEGAFRECTALQTITISSGVSNIHFTAFFKCTGLRNIYVNGANRYFNSMDGILCNKNKTALLVYPYQHGGDIVTIPEGIMEIGDNAFYENKRLIAVNFPNSLKKIGEQSFYSCSNLKNIEFPYGLEYIGYAAFRYCSSLTAVRIPSSVTEMNSYIFASCDSLKYASFDDGIETIPQAIFSLCQNLEAVYIPGSVKSIGMSAFNDCNNLKNVYFGGSEWDYGNIIYGNDNFVLNYSWVTKHYGTGLTDICSGELELSQTHYTYDGTAKRPGVTVRVNGRTIYDYTVTYLHNIGPGTADVIVTGVGGYTGTLWGSFEIEEVVSLSTPTTPTTPTTPSAPSTPTTPSVTPTPSSGGSESTGNNRKEQPLYCVAKDFTVRYSKLKKKKLTIPARRFITISNAKGTVTFKKSLGSKRIRISKDGKIIIKKGTPKGWYPFNFFVIASGNHEYLPQQIQYGIIIKIK